MAENSPNSQNGSENSSQKEETEENSSRTKPGIDDFSREGLEDIFEPRATVSAMADLLDFIFSESGNSVRENIVRDAIMAAELAFQNSKEGEKQVELNKTYIFFFWSLSLLFHLFKAFF